MKGHTARRRMQQAAAVQQLSQQAHMLAMQAQALGGDRTPAGALLQGIKRVFILGPSHHVYLRACCTTGCEAYDSPFGPMAVDAAVTAALVAAGHGCAARCMLETGRQETHGQFSGDRKQRRCRRTIPAWVIPERGSPYPTPISTHRAMRRLRPALAGLAER